MAVTRLSAAYNQSAPATITPDAGTNRYLLIFVGSYNDADTYSAISLNGSAMTKLADVTNSANTEAWGLVIPDAWSGALTLTTTGSGRMEILQFAGVDPSNPVLDVQNDNSGTGTDTAASLSIACLADGYVQDELNLATTTTPNCGANQTADNRVDTRGLSHYTTPVNGNVTMSWSFAGSRNVLVAVSLKPFKPSGGSSAETFTDEGGSTG